MDTIAESHSKSRLSAGWEPETPAADTQLRRFVRAWAESMSGPVAAVGGEVIRTTDFITADLGRPATYFNSAVLLRRPPRIDEWDQVLDGIESTMFRSGTGDVYLWSAWPTPDLTARDWRLAGHPPFLLRPPCAALPPVAPDVEVRPVVNEDDLKLWERIAVEGYPFPDLQPWHPGALFSPQVLQSRLRMWLAKVDGQAVGAAASCESEGMHVLMLGVVLPEFRGRGIWTTLLHTRLRAYAGILSGSVFSDLSRPGAQRHGFLPINRLTLWISSRDG